MAKREYFKFRINNDRELVRRLQKIADKQRRKLSGLVRYALYDYADREEALLNSSPAEKAARASMPDAQRLAEEELHREQRRKGAIDKPSVHKSKPKRGGPKRSSDNTDSPEQAQE